MLTFQIQEIPLEKYTDRISLRTSRNPQDSDAGICSTSYELEQQERMACGSRISSDIANLGVPQAVDDTSKA